VIRAAATCVLVLAFGYAAMAISQALWGVFGSTWSSWQLGALPFYLIWTAAAVGFGPVPWLARRRAPVTLLLVIAGSVAMYLPAFSHSFHAPVPMHLVASGIVGPLVEEYVFRGVLWNRLERDVPPWLVLALTSIVFGLFHLTFEGHSLAAFGNAIIHAAFGALMGVLRWRRGGIGAGCLIHVAGNSLMIVTML
jgi:membrane protease YdiL (CAAX protease family)